MWRSGDAKTGVPLLENSGMDPPPLRRTLYFLLTPRRGRGDNGRGWVNYISRSLGEDLTLFQQTVSMTSVLGDLRKDFHPSFLFKQTPSPGNKRALRERRRSPSPRRSRYANRTPSPRFGGSSFAASNAATATATAESRNPPPPSPPPNYRRRTPLRRWTGMEWKQRFSTVSTLISNLTTYHLCVCNQFNMRCFYPLFPELLRFKARGLKDVLRGLGKQFGPVLNSPSTEPQSRVFSYFWAADIDQVVRSFLWWACGVRIS